MTTHEELNRARSVEDLAALAEQRCETCRFWLLQDTNVGHCRRFPPDVKQVGNLGVWRWPTTLANEWCGEWWLRP
jgi:hypothetical protein